MAKATKTKAKQPTVRLGDRSEDTPLSPLGLRNTRLNAVLETLRAVRAEDCGDFFNEMRNGAGLRRLAKTLGVPFLLLQFIDQEHLETGSNGILPVDLREWDRWEGRHNLAVEDYVETFRTAELRAMEGV